MIEIVYMPSGPDPKDMDPETRWAKYASIHDPDEPFKLDPRLTNAQYGERAKQIVQNYEERLP